MRRVLKSVAWGFSRWMLKSPSSTRGVPSSGKFESTLHESVYVSFLTASLSLLDVFREYLHLFTCDWISYSYAGLSRFA